MYIIPFLSGHHSFSKSVFEISSEGKKKSKSSSHNHFFSSQLKLTFTFPSWNSFVFIQFILGNLISLLILQKKKKIIFLKSNWIYCFCLKYRFIFTGFTVLRCKYILALKKKANGVYYTLLGNIRQKAGTRETLKWKLLCAHTNYTRFQDLNFMWS